MPKTVKQSRRKPETKGEIAARHSRRRTETEGEIAARDDTRHAVYCLRDFIEQVQTPERLRNAFYTLRRYQAISPNDGMFSKAIEEAETMRTCIIEHIDSLTCRR